MMQTLANFPKYESYKDSGIEWLGNIPSDWQIKPGLVALSENKRDNKGMKEDTVLSLSYGRIVIKPVEKLVGLVPESFETYQIVEPDDIIIRCTDLQNDKVSLRTGLAKDKGIITSAYLNLKVRETFDSRFLHYYLHSLDTTKVLYKFGSGLRQNLSYVDFKRLPVFDIQKSIQETIAKFLDQKTAQIDEAIAIKKQQIKLLQERKQIIIQKAVTQGLDPNLPMKDSGVDWIGQIPEHWDTLQSKRVFWCKGGFAFPSQNFIEAGIPVLRISNIQDSSISTKGMVYVDQATPKILREFKTNTGDLIFCMTGAGLGKVGILPDDLNGALINQRVGRIDVNEKLLDKRFAFYVLTSLGYQKNIRMLGAGLTDNFPNISSEQIASIEMAVPPIECQIIIVEKISEDLKIIDDSIGLFSMQIDIFKEYKTSLINSAVTGKIKVTPDMVEQ